MPPQGHANARTGSVSPAQFERWPFWRRWFGQRSERVAAAFLRRQGYRILAANIADVGGELDLLALAPDRKSLVVIEVRSTSDVDPQKAANSVNLTKQKKLCAATARFLQRRQLLGFTVRFDVLAVAWPAGQPEPTFLHLPHAFEATGHYQFFT